MKRSQLILSLSATCGLALPSYGTTLVDDTFADGSRSEQNLPTESAWFNGGTGATLTPSVGHLVMGIPSGSASWETYFAAEATPATLANTGDNLTITWTFTTGTIGSLNTSQNFRLAVVDTSAAARLSTDAAPGSDNYPGYSMFMNMYTTLGNANPFQLRERTTAASDLLATSGNWTALGNGATSGNAGYANNTQYIYTMSLTRNAANGLDIVSTMTGAGLDGDGSETVSVTDATPASFTFDTFAVRPSGSTSTANQFDTTEFKAEFSSVPEPGTMVFAGLGIVGLFLTRRMRR